MPVQAKPVHCLPAPGRSVGRIIQRNAMSKMAVAPQRTLHPVSEPSDAHRFESLNANYKNIAAHAYGFSFATRELMADDTKIINKFIAAFNGRGKWTPKARKVSYDFGLGNKIEYTVNGRTYSTHDNTSQLYPLRGTDITAGVGAVAMGRVLRALKPSRLTDERKATLELIVAPRLDNWGKVLKLSQASADVKAALALAFTARLSHAVASPRIG